MVKSKYTFKEGDLVLVRHYVSQEWLPATYRKKTGDIHMAVSSHGESGYKHCKINPHPPFMPLESFHGVRGGSRLTVRPDINHLSNVDGFYVPTWLKSFAGKLISVDDISNTLCSLMVGAGRYPSQMFTTPYLSSFDDVQVGDTLLVRRDIIPGKEYQNALFTPSMSLLRGKEVGVKRVVDNCTVQTDINMLMEPAMGWTPHMFVKKVKKEMKTHYKVDWITYHRCMMQVCDDWNVTITNYNTHSDKEGIEFSAEDVKEVYTAAQMFISKMPLFKMAFPDYAPEITTEELIKKTREKLGEKGFREYLHKA